MEPAIVSACIDSREAFETVMQLEAHNDLSPNGVELLKHIEAYYKKDADAVSVDKEILLSLIEAKKPHSYEKLAAVIDNLPEPSAENLITLLVDQRLRKLGTEITAAFSVGDMDKVATLNAEWQELYQVGMSAETDIESKFEVYQGVGLHDLTKSIRDGADVVLLPGLLDEIVYDMMPGDHVILFGPVNAGKSAVAIQAACDYAYEGHTVLYIGNEDPADRMLIRIVCNLAGTPLSEARNDMDNVTEWAKEEGYDNIVFVSLSPGSMEDIEELCDKYQPTVCIVDQARNVTPAKRKGAFEDNQAEIMYQLRMMYKRRKLIGISMTQAANTDIRGKPLADKLKLEQCDIFGSKVEVAAQGDVMIGIGATESMKANGQLYLNVCKNKATGIHDGVMTFIDPQTSSLKGD